MIKFFRKMRQRLLSESKFSKYLIYAIGEIVLVVIGILIALQINNWNEAKNMTQWEQQFLKDLRNELLNDQKQLKSIHAIQMATGKALKETMALIQIGDENDKARIDSTYTLSQSDNPTFFPTTGVYDSSLSSGKVDQLQNDSLKYAIMNLYNHYYKRLIYNGEILDEAFEKVNWEKIKYYDEATGKTRSWEATMSSEFQAQIDFMLVQKKFYDNLVDADLNQLDRVILMISSELNQ